MSLALNKLLIEKYRLPHAFAQCELAEDLSESPGYFRFGDVVCHGRSRSGVSVTPTASGLHGAAADVQVTQGHVCLPFDPAEVADELRFERYVGGDSAEKLSKRLARSAYYAVRPLLPVAVRKYIQRMHASGWRDSEFPHWPVDVSVDLFAEELLKLAILASGESEVPFIWFWPEGRSACAIVTHDVETATGRDFCAELMDLNDSFAIKSSFQIVPEKRYTVAPRFLESIRRRGFEVNVHDLNHDGHLFKNKKQFDQRAKKINRYARQFGAAGFRSAVLYRNLEWFDRLDFEYDMSVPNVAHLDPQRGGCCTVTPYFVGKLVELPVTTIQDYTLFHLLNDYSTDLWRKQIAIIREHSGLMNFIIHPDYIIDSKARQTYVSLLRQLHQLRAMSDVWITLPRRVATWWRQRSHMSLVRNGGCWTVEGQGSERARVAFASIDRGRIVYRLQPVAAQHQAG